MQGSNDLRDTKVSEYGYRRTKSKPKPIPKPLNIRKTIKASTTRKK